MTEQKYVLLPCPFCSKADKPEVIHQMFGSLGLRYGVICYGCDCFYDCREKTIGEAVTAWNTRAAAPTEPRVELGAIRKLVYEEAYGGVLDEDADGDYLGVIDEVLNILAAKGFINANPEDAVEGK